MLDKLKTLWGYVPQPIKHVVRQLRYQAIRIGRGSVYPVDYQGCRFDVAHQRLEHYQCAKWFASFEPEFLDCFIEKARKSGVVYDIGSYIGTYSLAAAAINSQTTVIAFEPQPENYQAILENVSHNQFENVRVYSLAVGDQNSQVTFSHVGQTGSIDRADTELRPGATRQTVESITLDTLVQRDALPAPDLVKIDVEGYEAHVLRGMREIIANYHPTILLELHPSLMDAFSESVDELLAMLADLGYEKTVLHTPGDHSGTCHKQHHLLFEVPVKRNREPLESAA